jgi:hypothetical protein
MEDSPMRANWFLAPALANWFLAPALLFALACNDSKTDTDPADTVDTTDTTDTTDTPDTDETDVPAPTLSGDVQPILTASCATSGCHDGSVVPNLSDGETHGATVGVAGGQSSDAFVTAGDADASYLIAKVEGTQAAGSQMPLGASALDQADIDVIREWIDAGAADD